MVAGEAAYKIREHYNSLQAGTHLTNIYLNRMLNAVGIFMEKFHLLMQMAFASIEQAQQRPKKPVFVMPELPKSKWKKMQEKRANREGQAKRENLLQPTHSFGTFSSTKSDHIMPAIHAEKPIGEPEGVRKARQQMTVSLASIKQEERQLLLGLTEKMGLAQISFTLTHFISIPDPSWLTSPAFVILYDLIFNDKTLKKAKKCYEISSSDYIASIPAVQGKIKVFPAVFKTFYTKWNFQLFRLRLEENLLALPPLQAENVLFDSPIQQVLKGLRIAKIYRYSLTNEVHGLIGKYLLLRQGKLPIAPEPPVQEGLQLSDIGLFSPSASVEAREQAEIAQYWSLRTSQRLPACNSNFNYDCEKVLAYLRIDGHAPLTLPNFLHYLTRFQHRLIIIEDERTISTINSSRKSLDEAEKHYDALAAKMSVVRDGRSSLRKPIRPQPQYSVSTPLRIFTKWRSHGSEDGLSVGSIMLRLISRELPSFYAALQLFLRDYDTQVIIPRKKYVMELMTAISDYAALERQLAKQEAAYRRFFQNTGLRTPRRPITLQEPMAPRKEATAWNLQAVPYEEEKVEQSSFSIQQEDLEGESWDNDDEDEDEDDSDDQDQQQEDSDEVLEVVGDEGQALAEAVRTNNSEDSSSDVQEILPEEAFDQGDEEIEMENSVSSALAGQLPAILEQESSQQSSQSDQGQQQQAIMIDE